jgi:hypothetical protein
MVVGDKCYPMRNMGYGYSYLLFLPSPQEIGIFPSAATSPAFAEWVYMGWNTAASSHKGINVSSLLFCGVS